MKINNFYIQKIYWAIIKRYNNKKRQKTYQYWLEKGYNNNPTVSFIIQSHNKSSSVIKIINELRSYPSGEIIVIDDGSDYIHSRYLTKYLNKGNEFYIRSNDLYENIMYDKTIRFANGKYVVLLQDDDYIMNLDWIDRGLYYFNLFPDMVILGGRNGLNFSIDENNKWGFLEEYKNFNLYDKDFYFVHSVNRAPMLINKALFLEHLKNIDFSFAPYQCDDCDLCLRSWLTGLKVGWFNAGFKSLIAGGMRIWNNNLTGFQEIKNRGKLYEMYKDKVQIITEKVQNENLNRLKN